MWLKEKKKDKKKEKSIDIFVTIHFRLAEYIYVLFNYFSADLRSQKTADLPVRVFF